MKLVPMSAAVLAAALALANAASAAGPLPVPPPQGGAASSSIFDAMLAISRASRLNWGAAQTASGTYDTAITQYNAKNYDQAHQSAVMAIAQTDAAPLPRPSIYAPPIPQPSYYPMPLVASTDQSDAEGFVALARRSMSTCGAPGATATAAISQQYMVAVEALLASRFKTARTSSQYVVDQCAAATQAYAAAQAALPQPSSTPIPMSPYSPVPLATLGPDPALQPGNRN